MQTQSLPARDVASKSRSERIERARSACEILVYIYIYASVLLCIDMHRELWFIAGKLDRVEHKGRPGLEM